MNVRRVHRQNFVLENVETADKLLWFNSFWCVQDQTEKVDWNTVGRIKEIRTMWQYTIEPKNMSILKLNEGNMSKIMCERMGYFALQFTAMPWGKMMNACTENIETMEIFLCHCPSILLNRGILMYWENNCARHSLPQSSRMEEVKKLTN